MTTEGDSRSRIVLSWLREDASENAERVLLRALDEVEATAQRRPLWPVRRFSEMSTTARLLAAAALVALGVAGTAIVASGGIGPKSTPPVAPTAISPPAASATVIPSGAAVLAEFTACLPTNTILKEGTITNETVEGPSGDVTVEKARGTTYKGTLQATDPRFSGTHYYTWTGNSYTGPDGEHGPGSYADAMRIENSDGAWQGSSFGVELPDGTQQNSVTVLTGEGGYAGLSAVLFDTGDAGPCFFDYRGIVMEVPEPPVPGTD